MRRSRQVLAALTFLVLLPVMAVVLPPSVDPVAAHDDPLEDKLDVMNSLPPELAPDRSDLQVVGLETWLAPHWATSITPVPDVHEHGFLFWSYTESYLALPRRSIFNFLDGVNQECDRRGSRYSPGATNPDCGRDWYHTTAVVPMALRTQMEYRVIRFTPWPRVYNLRTDESWPYLLDVGEIQAVGREVSGSSPLGPLPDGPSTGDCTSLFGGGPCVNPDDVIDVQPVSWPGGGGWNPLPGDPCADAQVLVASIDASAIRQAMLDAANDPCTDGDGGDDPDSDGDPVDPVDDPPPPISCDELEAWGEWWACVRDAVVDELAAIASKVYELLPPWAQAIVRSIDGCLEFGEEALRDIWEAFKEAGEALSDFPTWLEEKLAEIRELIDAIRDDPEGFLLELGREIGEADLYEEDPAAWAGKMTCKIAAAILLGKGSQELLRAARNSRDRGDNDGNDDRDGPDVAAYPPASPSGYTHGASDGGPGQWGPSPTRTRGQDYQEQVTGAPRGTEYQVNGVWFDGYDPNRDVLLDAKEWNNYPPVDSNGDVLDFARRDMVDEANRQLNAAGDKPVEWIITDPDNADLVREVFEEEGIDFTVVVVPSN